MADNEGAKGAHIIPVENRNWGTCNGPCGCNSHNGWIAARQVRVVKAEVTDFNLVLVVAFIALYNDEITRCQLLQNILKGGFRFIPQFMD